MFFSFDTACALNSFAWGLCRTKSTLILSATHPGHRLASSLHPLLASLHFTHLRGQLCAPLASQKTTHTHKPHSSLSAPASFVFLPVPQSLSSTRPTMPWVPVRADCCHLSRLPFFPLPTLVTYTLFILWVRTQFKSPFSISHMPHNGVLLIYWSVLFTAHQGTVTHQ